MMPDALPSLSDQAERLIFLGVPALFDQFDQQTRDAAAHLDADQPGLLVPAGIPTDYADLMGKVELGGKTGFVVEDFTDASQFQPLDTDEAKPTKPASASWYVLADPRRGDEFENASPAEALASIGAAGRVPLTIVEGIVWLLQTPTVLERNHCFMTIGSRKAKPKGGFDARTAALWISNGTGRDGAERKDAPKLGWCWWNNRHTWLGIAHAADRLT